MRRRDFMKALGLLSSATLWPAARRLDAAAQAPEASKSVAFSAGEVQKQARALAAEKFVPPKSDLPKELQELGYDLAQVERLQQEEEQRDHKELCCRPL